MFLTGKILKYFAVLTEVSSSASIKATAHNLQPLHTWNENPKCVWRVSQAPELSLFASPRNKSHQICPLLIPCVGLGCREPQQAPAEEAFSEHALISELPFPVIKGCPALQLNLHLQLLFIFSRTPTQSTEERGEKQLYKEQPVCNYRLCLMTRGQAKVPR